MRLFELKDRINSLKEINFTLPDGAPIPSHFHVTEVGLLDKKYIDCGGTLREEKIISFQLWHSSDYDHRLAAQKLADIIALSESKLGLEDWEIEVEYQGATIGKYGLEFKDNTFQLTPTLTDCLAPDKCGLPTEKKKLDLASIGKDESVCSPNSGCC